MMSIYSVNISSLGGVAELCEIEFERNFSIELKVKSSRFGLMSFTDENWFGALTKFRLRIERDGYFLLCNAARKDAYPSRMTLEMGGGRKIYLLTPGIQTNFEDLVDVLGAASIDQVCSVEEQRIYYENWIRSFE